MIPVIKNVIYRNAIMIIKSVIVLWIVMTICSITGIVMRNAGVASRREKETA